MRNFIILHSLEGNEIIINVNSISSIDYVANRVYLTLIKEDSFRLVVLETMDQVKARLTEAGQLT